MAGEQGWEATKKEKKKQADAEGMDQTLKKIVRRVQVITALENQGRSTTVPENRS